MLARKQRHFEPHRLTVPPFTENDACRLLFRGIGLKNPSISQQQKGIALVRDFEFLSFAIHATSHRLNATQKPIMKYKIHSNLTDTDLDGLFLAIMYGLHCMEHFAALNLINFLAFLCNQVPLVWHRSFEAPGNRGKIIVYTAEPATATEFITDRCSCGFVMLNEKPRYRRYRPILTKFCFVIGIIACVLCSQ